ncbi:MAG TPA: amidohydrolase family protein, partial [Terracidiphilus sp.]
QTGPDQMIDGVLHTPYQYTEAQLAAAVEEAHRMGTVVAVHAMGEPGALYAAEAGVASIDHGTQLSDETMQLMKQKGIFAVPTFTIFDYFAHHATGATEAASESAILDYKISEFKKQIAAGISFAVGSDVGPFPHGTQARELTLMVRYGMKPLAVLQADMINGAKLLGWAGQIGELKPGYFADIIAVPGNPLDDISAVEHVQFVMKNGEIVRR